MGNDDMTVPPQNRRGGGVGTGVMTKALEIIADDKARDAETAGKTVDALQSMNTSLVRALVVCFCLIAMIIAGILGVGVTGHVSGVGDIAIESD